MAYRGYQFFTVTLDNASNNDALVDELYKVAELASIRAVRFTLSFHVEVLGLG